jgi:hypothetical protein
MRFEDSPATPPKYPCTPRRGKKKSVRNLEKNVDRDRGTSVSILQFLTDSFFPVGLTGKLFSSGGLTPGGVIPRSMQTPPGYRNRRRKRSNTSVANRL